MLEVNLYGLWGGKQTAKGSPNSTPTHRLQQVTGGFATARDDGSENFSDGSDVYGSFTDWVNSIGGTGSPGIEATPDELAFLAWMHHGGETVTAAVNDVQTVALGSPSAGTFTLTYTPVTGAAQTTSALAFNAASSAVQTALQALSSIGSGNATVSGSAGGPYTVTFASSLAGRPQQILTIDGTGLTGGTPSVTHTTSGAKTKHTFVPLPGIGFYGTYFQRVGGTQIIRQQFNDSIITQFQVEGSTANKAVRVTPTIMSLDPAQTFSTDPSQAMPSRGSLLYTDGTGTFTIDAVAIPAQSQFTFVGNRALTPVYGDDTVPVDLQPGNATATLTATCAFNSDTLNRFNNLVYGTATPTAGQRPLKTIPPLGSYSFDLQARSPEGRVTGDRFKLAIPGVKWTVPDAPDPNPDGATPEMALAGGLRGVVGQPKYTIDVYCDSTAFTT